MRFQVVTAANMKILRYVVVYNLNDVSEVLVHVDVMRIYFRNAAIIGPFIHPQMIYECGEPRWNDIDRVNSKSEKNLPKYQFVHYKPHMELSELESRPPL
jgi:hypothetical protein